MEYISNVNLGMCPTPPFLTATACVSLQLLGFCVHSNTSLIFECAFQMSLHGYVMPTAYEPY